MNIALMHIVVQEYMEWRDGMLSASYLNINAKKREDDNVVSATETHRIYKAFDGLSIKDKEYLAIAANKIYNILYKDKPDVNFEL